MDMIKAAGYHDRLSFDVYDPLSDAWTLKVFKAQLKIPDNFTSIWNRPTRKRLLFTTPKNVNTAPLRVVRVSDMVPEHVYMIGTTHYAAYSKGVAYRAITGLHLAEGQATIFRRLPTGPGNDPGWAIQSQVGLTYADLELRSVNEGLEEELIQYGHSFLFLPAQTDIQPLDTVVLNGISYQVVNHYIDSGFISARVVEAPDERVDIYYVKVGVAQYDPTTQKNTPVNTTYAITAKVKLMKSEDMNISSVDSQIEVIVQNSFIGFQPRLNDKITYDRKDYKIVWFEQNDARNQWTIKAAL